MFKNKKYQFIRYNFFKSSDDGLNWTLVEKDDVPEQIKSEESMKKLLDGMGAHYQGDVYIAMRLQ